MDGLKRAVAQVALTAATAAIKKEIAADSIEVTTLGLLQTIVRVRPLKVGAPRYFQIRVSEML